jgi:hypothetical protein
MKRQLGAIWPEVRRTETGTEDTAAATRQASSAGPAESGNGTTATARSAALLSETRAIRALCLLEHNECRYPGCQCGPSFVGEYRQQARAVLRAVGLFA